MEYKGIFLIYKIANQKGEQSLNKCAKGKHILTEMKLKKMGEKNLVEA